jgi:transposase-like protein
MVAYQLRKSGLRDGNLTCPRCSGQLRPWGSARFRVLRLGEGEQLFAPRRGRCRSCASTSVLLPDVALVRRVDEAAVIGAALLAKAAGSGQRKIAAALGRPRETVRSWLQRFASRAERIRVHFVSWALALDARLEEIAPRSTPFAQALEAIGLATRAASILLGPRPPWSFVTAMTDGALLSNTSSPFPAPR